MVRMGYDRVTVGRFCERNSFGSLELGGQDMGWLRWSSAGAVGFFTVGLIAWTIVRSATPAFGFECPFHGCFYSSCIRSFAGKGGCNYYDDCTIGGVTKEFAHTGATVQDREAISTKDVKVSYWTGLNCTTVCTSTEFPIEANCSKPSKSTNLQVYCARCGDNS